MTMTETEAKALALVNAAAQDRHYPIWPSFERSNGSVHEALCRAIEREAATETRHAAELREQAERFSEAILRTKELLKYYQISPDADALDFLAPFILPAPDPLVEVLKEEVSHHAGLHEELADRVHAAMQARGYEWRKIGEAGE